jgi:hypothetical protein
MAITYPQTPVLIDAFVIAFNTKIVQSLTWLNNPLGKVQEITKHLDGRYTKTPAMFDIGGEYIDIFPDDALVNYSWFQFGAIEPFDSLRMSKVKMQASFNLFVNLNTIYPNVQSRNIENLKLSVLNALKGLHLLNGALRVVNVSERMEDVYKGFKLNEVQDKYFMQPYAGLSFQLEIYLRNNICN